MAIAMDKGELDQCKQNKVHTTWKALYFHCHKIDIEGSSISRTSEDSTAELNWKQARMNVEEHT